MEAEKNVKLWIRMWNCELQHDNCKVKLRNKRLIDWLIDWPTDWLILLIDFIDWLILLIDWQIDWLVDWLTDWLTDWKTYWLIDCLIDW